MLQEQQTLPLGAIIQDQQGERYIIEDLLGQGGFSAVYLVQEKRGRQRKFALKEIIDPDTQEKSHLVFESQLLQRLEHRSLPHVYQVFENSELKRIYMLMDFIDGKNLEILRRDQPEHCFSLALSLALMTPIVDAVSYLHTRTAPIVHRDIKPANIIIPTGTGGAMLVDFGLAKEYVENKTTSVFRYGTPGYASPEQYGQGTNPRTDIYALGATLYTLLTGKIPVDALTRSVEVHTKDPLEAAHLVRPDISPAISDVIVKAMSLRVEARYNSVEDFWQELSMAVINGNTMKHQAIAPFPPALSEQDKLILTTTKLLPTDNGQKASQSKNVVRKAFTNRPVYLYNKKRRSWPKNLLIGLIILFVLGGIGAELAFRMQDAQTPTQRIATPTAKTKDTLNTLLAKCTTPQAADQIQAGSYPPMQPCYEGTIGLDATNLDGQITQSTKQTPQDKQGPPLYLLNIKQTSNIISGEADINGAYVPFKGIIDSNSNVEINAKATRQIYEIHFIISPTGDSGEFQLTNENRQMITSGAISLEPVPTS